MPEHSGAMQSLCLAVIGMFLPFTAALGSVSHTFFLGKEVYENCSLPANKAECIAYFMGATDAMGGSEAPYGWRICILMGVTGDVVMSVIMEHMRTHPEERDGSAASIIAKALSQAFPCAD